MLIGVSVADRMENNNHPDRSLIKLMISTQEPRIRSSPGEDPNSSELKYGFHSFRPYHFTFLLTYIVTASATNNPMLPTSNEYDSS